MADRIPVAEYFFDLSEAMNGSKRDLPAFPQKFYVVNVGHDKPFYLRADPDEIVRPTSPEGISKAIMQYAHYQMRGRDCWKDWISRTATDAFRFWSDCTRPIEMPPSWLWCDEPGLTFHRVPFRPIFDATANGCPRFMEMMRRMSNYEAVMAWIGSIFDATSDLQQYVWLYGHGNDGKGALARFLTRVLANAVIWQQPPNRGDKFWTHSLIGKRLVVYGDCNESGFVTSGLFKSMTGGDLIPIEEKFGARFSAKLVAKHLFLSNKRPTIDGDNADQRRIIYSEITGIDCPPDRAYEEQLWNEGAAFLGMCQRAYMALDGKRIPVNPDESERLASMKEEDLSYSVQRFFEISPSHEMSAFDFQEQCRAAGFLQNQQQRRLYDYLNREHGVAKLRRGAGDRAWYYAGLASKGHLRVAREQARPPLQPT